MLELEGQIKMKRCVFSRFLKMGKDSAAGTEFEVIHQIGTVNVKVCESDFVSLWDGTVMRRSLAERKLLEAHESEVMNLVNMSE